MNNIIIIVSEHDIPLAENLVSEIDIYKAYFFDPTLVDVIKHSTLQNTELIIWDACPDYPALHELAHTQSLMFERDLDQYLRPLLTDSSIVSWQHLNLFYFFLTHHWYSGLWRDMREILGEGKLHVFINDNPTYYYWPSFLPSLLLLEQLRTWGVSFSAVLYGARSDESDVVMNLCDGNPQDERFDLLTHLPTCFYDVGYFNDEIKSSGKSNINIEPKYWGVALDSTKSINLIRLKDQQILSGGWPKLDIVYSQLFEKIDSLLHPYIATADFRARQARQLANLYQSQWVGLHLLEQYFNTNKPGKMLLSDHDAGFHGPLISYAEKFNIPVFMVPHSKSSGDIYFDYSNVTMLTHPMQGVPPSNSKRKRLLHFTLPYAEIFTGKSSMPAPIKRIGLLLNGLSANGILCTEFSTYINGIKQINQWCKQNSIELSIRGRYGQTLIEILSQEIGAERSNLQASLDGTLQAFAQSIDLCLMYDQPSTAVIEFLRTGIPILNPIPAPLCKTEEATTSSQIVPRASVEVTLDVVKSLIVDNNNFHVFCRNQFSKYVNLFTDSYALRRLL